MKAVTLCLFLVFFEFTAADICISCIQPNQYAQAKRIIVQTQIEVWELPYTSFEEAVAAYGPYIADLDDIPNTYLNDAGTFLVITDGDIVIGTGAIKKLDTEICELKRLWICAAYRSQGLGTQLVQQLLEFAKTSGYKKIRLDVFAPEKQSIAVTFFKKLGFVEIDQYKESVCKLFMEKEL